MSIGGLVVLTRSHPQDKPLLASSIEVSIKCYESRLGGAFAVVASETLWASEPTTIWAAPDGAAETTLADWEGKFNVGVPVDAGRDKGRSTVSLKEYRVVWKLEVGEWTKLVLFRCGLGRTRARTTPGGPGGYTLPGAPKGYVFAASKLALT